MYSQEPNESKPFDQIETTFQKVAMNRTFAGLERDRSEPEYEETGSPKAAELEACNRVMLQRRDQLLEATARATNILLTLENFDEAVNTALKIIGEETGCDRISILENIFAPPSQFPTLYNVIYEWSTSDFLRLTDRLESNCLPAEAIKREFLEQYFLKGEGFGGLLEEWEDPLRSSFAAACVQSAYAVPIRVNGQWWGVLCFDYCRAPIQVSPAEVAVLRTLADCIGSAIQRNRIRQEREQVIQQRAADLEEYNQLLLKRDQLLEATARATNVLLTLENIEEAINTALRIIGEGIGCDLVIVLENIFEPSSQLPKCCNFIYEWAAPGFLSLTANFGLTSLPAEVLGFAFLEQYFLEGEGFGGLIDVWDEPLQGLLASVQVKSAYSVPIRVNGQWWGLLCLDYCRAPIQVNAAEIAVLMTIADCIGSAIQRDRTHKIILQAEQLRVAELVKANTALKHSLDILAAEPDLDCFIGHTLQLIAQQFDAPMVEYWNHLEQGDQAQFHLRYWQGQIFKANEIQQFSKQLGREVDQAPAAQGLMPFLDIPLSIGDATIGALSIYLPKYQPFSGQMLELAHALTQQLTLAIELSRLAEEAQQSALLQERTRMAREIHDTLAQTFGGILIQLQAATYFTNIQSEQAQTHLLTAQNLAREGLAEARRSIWTLYLEATEYEDPARTIAKFIDYTSSYQAIPIHLAIDGAPYRLHPDLGLNLLRIAQEAITNALRHANAQTIQICLSYSPHCVQLMICDDGCGFEPESPTRGFGLLGMQQRADRIGANWHLVSQAGQGTTITITMTNPTTP